VRAESDFNPPGFATITVGSAMDRADGGAISQCATWHDAPQKLDALALLSRDGFVDVRVAISPSVDFDYCPGGAWAEFETTLRIETCAARPSPEPTRAPATLEPSASLVPTQTPAPSSAPTLAPRPVPTQRPVAFTDRPTPARPSSLPTVNFGPTVPCELTGSMSMFRMAEAVLASGAFPRELGVFLEMPGLEADSVLSATLDVEIRGDFRGAGLSAIFLPNATHFAGDCVDGDTSQCVIWDRCRPTPYDVTPHFLKTGSASVTLKVSDDVDFDYCVAGIVAELRVILEVRVKACATLAPSPATSRPPTKPPSKRSRGPAWSFRPTFRVVVAYVLLASSVGMALMAACTIAAVWRTQPARIDSRLGDLPPKTEKATAKATTAKAADAKAADAKAADAKAADAKAARMRQPADAPSSEAPPAEAPPADEAFAATNDIERQGAPAI